MKRIMKIMIIAVCTMALLAGCGSDKKSEDKGSSWNGTKGGTISNDKITINKYVGLEAKEVVPDAVTDEMIESAIQSDLQTIATKVSVTDRASQEGDTIVVDYVGKLDGVAFKGGTATDASITLGAGGYIDGFEEGMIGHKVGETFDVDATFPDPYQNNTDLSGKAVVFTVTMKSITETIVPKLSEEVLPQLSQTATTIEEYRAEVVKYLELSNQATADKNYRGVVLNELVHQCEVKEFPQEDLDTYINSYKNQYSAYAESAGMDVEEIIEMVYGIPVEEIAKAIITESYALELIAEVEEITVSDEEYETGVAAIAQQYGYDAETLKTMIDEADLRQMVLETKVEDFLVENSVKVKAEE